MDRKSSKEITAKFCLEKLLKTKTSLKKNIRVINPDAKAEKADKKINLADFTSSTPQYQTKDIQTILAKLKYLDSQYVTGIYGPITTNAVKAFQKDNKLKQTGLVDSETWAKLEKKGK